MIEKSRAGPAGAGAANGTRFGRSAVFGWTMFDIAAQPFFTLVTTFIFGPYFVSQFASDPAQGQTAWAAAATVSGLLVAFLAPLLGAVADRWGPRKPWIAVLAVVQIMAMSALWTVAPGTGVALAILFIVLATVTAELSIVFNDAMMPRLVPRRKIGVVSNIAWGLGYCAGMVTLVATIVFLAASPETGRTLAGLAPLFGLDPATGEGARAVGPFSALWYAVLVLPMFMLVPDMPRTGLAMRSAMREGVGELLGTLRELRSRAPLFRFILARLFYQDGVNGILLLGGAFAAATFGWSVAESGAFGILLNVFAIFGCIAASFVDRRFGSRSVVMISILLFIVATVGISSTTARSVLFGLVEFDGLAPPAENAGLFSSPAEQSFLVFGAMIGLAFGPIQASSRSWLAQSVAVEEAGRWFGLYAFTGRVTAFLAPLSVTLLTAAAARYTDPNTAMRIGMSVLILFFLAGFALLLTTRDPRAH